MLEFLITKKLRMERKEQSLIRKKQLLLSLNKKQLNRSLLIGFLRTLQEEMIYPKSTIKDLTQTEQENMMVVISTLLG